VNLLPKQVVQPIQYELEQVALEAQLEQMDQIQPLPMWPLH
jgi:hypothetical protein